jgi:N-acetylmuramic acid 6-phosphate (MurNAc-6-P) etherase
VVNRDGVKVPIPTEQRNAASADLDLLDTAGVLRVINEADAQVADAVARALGALTVAVDSRSRP